MWLIVSLILVAALLLVAEIVIIPGLSVAGIAAFLAAGAAVWIAFARYGAAGGWIAAGAVVVVSIASVAMSLRSRTWHRLSLKENIDSAAQQLPQDENVRPGDRGKAITRLAPMGKVSVAGRTYEAKSIDAYIDEHSEVEVTGFDNFNIIVRKINN